MPSKYLVIGTFDQDSLESFFAESLASFGLVSSHNIGSNIIVKYRQKIINSFPIFWFYYLTINLRRITDDYYKVIFVIMRDLPLDNLKYLKNRFKDSILVNINPDQMTTIGNMSSMVNLYDYVFLKDKYLGRKMIDVGARNIRFWLECYPEKWNQLHTPIVPNSEVIILGNIYYYRHLFIESLLDKKGDINLRVFGRADKVVRSLVRSYVIENYIYGRKKLETIRNSSIVINNLHFAEITSANNKFFEYAGAGAFVLTEYSQDIYESLPDRLRVLIWNNMDELVVKINYFLTNIDLRESLRQELHEYAKLHFTFTNRVKAILEEIK